MSGTIRELFLGSSVTSANFFFKTGTVIELFLEFSPTVPDFFRNPQLATRSFFKSSRTLPDFFLKRPGSDPTGFRWELACSDSRFSRKSPATRSNFFENVYLPSRSFSGILRSRPELFRECPGRAIVRSDIMMGADAPIPSHERGAPPFPEGMPPRRIE